jgi:Protein of unknown function (DUF4038)
MKKRVALGLTLECFLWQMLKPRTSRRQVVRQVQALVRRDAYSAMLCGAAGQFLGNNPIWHFDGPGLFPATETWQQALGGPGSRDMTRLRDAFATLPWPDLVPDTTHALVADDGAAAAAALLTATTPDRRVAVVYVPSTGTAPRSLSLHLTEPFTTRWVNPADTNNPPDVMLPAGDQTLRSPGDNGTGANDWLLVLTAGRPER